MFANCKNYADLKAAYKKAAMQHHPDRGGDVEKMKEVNAAYDAALERIRIFGEKFDQTGDEPKKTTTVEEMEDYKVIIDKLAGLKGLDIELCGTWLWIGGNTKENKDALKAAGCRWSANKKKWYWHDGTYKRRSRKKYSMDQIRDMHGSEKINARRAEIA